jgi:hypothetical protein
VLFVLYNVIVVGARCMQGVSVVYHCVSSCTPCLAACLGRCRGSQKAAVVAALLRLGLLCSDSSRRGRGVECVELYAVFSGKGGETKFSSSSRAQSSSRSRVVVVNRRSPSSSQKCSPAVYS